MSDTHAAETVVGDAVPDGVRLDVFIADHMGLFSRSQVRARVVAAEVNGRPARLARRLKAGDAVRVTWSDPPPLALAAEDIPLSILYEDADALVIDKPQGMVVHPGSGNRSGTLVNAVLAHCAGLAEAFGAGEARPGIVHRLDKDTSGVIVVARNPRALEYLAAQFRARTARKRYIAIVKGRLPAPSGRIETRLGRHPRDRKRFACVRTGGRLSVTYYRVLREYPGYSLVSLRPRTGRTHQLRVHMRHLHAPILGDPLYGHPDERFPDVGLMLHARSLEIALPGQGPARVFDAPLPARFRRVLKELQSLSPR
jgi:23S rRNA pseudouridine1911/1915/1917 synthase